MSITNYTNFDKLDIRLENEGKYILDKDINIISKNEKEFTDFGDCGNDVMEVSIYDINNNLLPHFDGNFISYIKSDKIKKYLYKVNTPSGVSTTTPEIALDAKTLLNDLGFQNGILKLNINFVKTKVGNESDKRKCWIQEISPSRQEIRVLPLKTNDNSLDSLNQTELFNLSNLNKEFKYFKKSIFNIINDFQSLFLNKVDDVITQNYGNDFFTICKRDFGLNKFESIQTKIYKDFINSVDHYFNNRGYNINKPNYGKNDGVRFVDCDIYEYDFIFEEIMNILYICVDYNLQFLKRREIDTRGIPTEFKPIDLTPNLQNIKGLIPPIDEVTVVYDPTATIPKPINNNAAVVRNKIDIETYLKYAEAIGLTQSQADQKPPTEVKVTPVANTYSYKIVNTNSKSTSELSFYDATGTSVKSYVGPGETVVICAVENTISVTNIQGSRVASGYNTAMANEYIITKIDRCNTVDISRTAPKPTENQLAGYTQVSGYKNISGYTNIQTSGYTNISGYGSTRPVTNITVLPSNTTTNTTNNTVSGYTSTPTATTTSTTTPVRTNTTTTTPPRTTTTTNTQQVRGGGGGGGGSFGGYSIGGYNRF